VAARGARAAGGDARSRRFLRFGYVMFGTSIIRSCKPQKSSAYMPATLPALADEVIE
jgi:hypothetical protein